jgi:hypothetical protein
VDATDFHLLHLLGCYLDEGRKDKHDALQLYMDIVTHLGSESIGGPAYLTTSTLIETRPGVA